MFNSYVKPIQMVNARLNHVFIQNPTPSKVLGVFGLSVRTTERELEDEFNRFGRVENVTIVYDQRVRTATA